MIIVEQKIFTPQDSKLTDIVFIVDYSDSMNYTFDDISNGIKKIDVLRYTFGKLNNTILQDKSIKTIGFIPFSWGTKTIIGKGRQSKEYCHFPYVPKNYKVSGDYFKQHTASNLKPF